ncbi:uncharacterized protein LOC130897476 [Diorhabda carinulata]|uniref:uncharacterized protein LOC130897476 n=1 Tax=Diorhabda carinulata TaxID=1163345 RepID=UPI0025A0B299|nr:uncharacterized protein LOC130897476 [Diorhabda carinulata]
MSDSVKIILSVCEKLAKKHNLNAEIPYNKFKPRAKHFGGMFILFGGGLLANRIGLLPRRFGLAVPVVGFIGYTVIKSLNRNRHIKAIDDVIKSLSTSQKIELASAVGNILKKNTGIGSLDETAILKALDPLTELFIINEIVQILRQRLYLDVCLSL